MAYTIDYPDGFVMLAGMKNTMRVTFPDGITENETVTHNLGRDAEIIDMQVQDADGQRVVMTPIITHSADKNSFSISANITGVFQLRFR